MANATEAKRRRVPMACLGSSKERETDTAKVGKTLWKSLPNLPGQSSLPFPQKRSGLSKCERPSPSSEVHFHYTHTTAFDVVKLKAAEALQFAIKARNFNLGLQQGPPRDMHHMKRFKGPRGELVDVRWNPEIAEIALAFQVPDDLLYKPQPATGSKVPLERLQSLKYGGLRVQVQKTVAMLLEDLLVGNGMHALKSFIGGTSPRRVVCTGLNSGGALAVVASVVMAVEFPGADVRCVTLNSPIISYGNAAFAWIYRLMVGFSYHLTTECDAYKEICSKAPGLEDDPSRLLLDPAAIYGHWTLGTEGLAELAEKASEHPEMLGKNSLMQLVSSGHLCDCPSQQACYSPNPMHKPSQEQEEEAAYEASAKQACKARLTEAPSLQVHLPELTEERADKSDSVEEGPEASDELSDDSCRKTGTGLGGTGLEGKLHYAHWPSGNGCKAGDSETGAETFAEQRRTHRRTQLLMRTVVNMTAMTQHKLARSLSGLKGEIAAFPAQEGKNAKAKEQGLEEQDRGIDMRTLIVKLAESQYKSHGCSDGNPQAPRTPLSPERGRKPAQAIPTGKAAISLDWTDDPLHAIFQNLNTVEKLLISGKKLLSIANMAKAAYDSGEVFMESVNINHSVFVNRDQKGQKDGQAHVAWRPAINTLIVAFRGTSSSADMLVDARFSLKSARFLNSLITGARVHCGFHDQLKDMWEDLEAAIDDVRAAACQQASVEHIIVTGHSLGGALATIGGPLLAKKFPRADVRVITFAAPRAGNEKFAAAFESLIGTSLRFHFNYDPVPCTPFGYKHVENCVYMKPANIKKPVEGPDKGASFLLNGARPHSIAACLGTVSLEQALANHSMYAHYLGSLLGYSQAQVHQETSKGAHSLSKPNVSDVVLRSIGTSLSRMAQSISARARWSCPTQG
eukprot:jgi/Botrbrau1/12129/Bobra.0186s0046.1